MPGGPSGSPGILFNANATYEVCSMSYAANRFAGRSEARICWRLILSNRRLGFVPRALVVSGFAIAIAACASKPLLPPPPPPPPAKIVVIPAKPTPPDGAAAGLMIPPADSAGLRQSVNRDISPNQMVWNLRSAFNVAALNCKAAKHAEILPAYRLFLKSFGKKLSAANRQVDTEFKSKHGARYAAPRDAYMTTVYNHFALPPTQPHFCDATMAVMRDMPGTKTAELEAFAARSLPSVEVVFDDFYRRYATYQADLAAWEAMYRPKAAQTQ